MKNVNKSFLPKKCRLCKKWKRGWYIHNETGEDIILCKNCHLAVMCAPIFNKIK